MARISALVGEAVGLETLGFKERFGTALFSAGEVLRRLQGSPEWVSLGVTQAEFYRAVRRLGWVRCIARFRAPHGHRQKLKLWIKSDRT